LDKTRLIRGMALGPFQRNEIVGPKAHEAVT
jgi:hypothetical protein